MEKEVRFEAGGAVIANKAEDDFFFLRRLILSMSHCVRKYFSHAQPSVKKRSSTAMQTLRSVEIEPHAPMPSFPYNPFLMIFCSSLVEVKLPVTHFHVLGTMLRLMAIFLLCRCLIEIQPGACRASKRTPRVFPECSTERCKTLAMRNRSDAAKASSVGMPVIDLESDRKCFPNY